MIPEDEWVRPKAVAPPTEVEVGELVGWEDGSIWRVEHRTKGAADMRCVKSGRMNGPGRRLTCAPSRAGYTFPTEAELEDARAFDEVASRMCDDCWARHGEEGECALECACHEKRRRRRGGVETTDEEVAAVLALREAGLGYAAIEREMGWPDTHGNRPWKICKAAERAAKGAE